MSDDEVTHDCPREGESVTLCCGRSPFELPSRHRMTLDSALVTCNRPVAESVPAPQEEK